MLWVVFISCAHLLSAAVHSPQTEKRSTRSIKKNKDNDFDKFKLNNLDPLAEKDDDDSLQEEIKPSVEVRLAGVVAACVWTKQVSILSLVISPSIWMLLTALLPSSKME